MQGWAVQPPHPGAAACSGAAPQHARPRGLGARLHGHGPGRQGTHPGFTHRPARARTSSAARATAAGQREITAAAAQTGDSYLSPGLHPNTRASASRGWAGALPGADISASARRRRTTGGGTCCGYLGRANRRALRSGWGHPGARLGTPRGSAGPTSAHAPLRTPKPLWELSPQPCSPPSTPARLRLPRSSRS